MFLITYIFNHFFQRPGGKSGNAPPDPMFHISVGKATKQSPIVYRTDHPVFAKEFTFLVSNPETDTMHMKVRYIHRINKTKIYISPAYKLYI